MRLDGATVLVTGGTGEVGWGIAHAAADAGAELLLTASRESSAARLAEEFPDATVVQVDLRTRHVATAIPSAIDVAGGRLDHVVAPIGSWWQQGPTLSQPTEELETLLATYPIAQHRLLVATASFLSASRGSYTLVSGAAGKEPIPDAGMLVVAVRAQWGLADVLREELREARFRFNEVRISTRIERDPRPGVTPSREAGEAFVDVMAGDVRSEVVPFPG